jgi:hypothetical protein
VIYSCGRRNVRLPHGQSRGLESAAVQARRGLARQGPPQIQLHAFVTSKLHQPLDPQPCASNAASFPIPPVVVLCCAKSAFHLPSRCGLTFDPHYSCLEAVRTRLFQISRSRGFYFVPRILWNNSTATYPKRSSSRPLHALFLADRTPWTAARCTIATRFRRT